MANPVTIHHPQLQMLTRQPSMQSRQNNAELEDPPQAALHELQWGLPLGQGVIPHKG